MNEIVAGIDIGSSKVCTILGELNKNNQMQILGVGTAECKGIKKGIIIDIDNAAKAISDSVEQAERMSGMGIKSAYINIAGGHVSLFKNRGVIAVSGDDREISEEDVERVIQNARIADIPVDMEIVDAIPLQFIVDGYEGIKDPVGMVAVRLEVDVYLLIATTSTVQNLVKSVERCNINVSGIVIDPLSSGEVVLSKDEKELGVALIDVGGEVTDISIFKDGNLIYTKLIPVGGNHITNDISIGLKIPLSEAEALKRQYGCASLSMIDSAEDISVNNRAAASNAKTISISSLTDIIEARVQEIYYLVNRELELSSLKSSLSAGIVLTGGGLSFIKGSAEVGNSIIGLPIRIGVPNYIGVASPIYSTATGMVKYKLTKKKYNVLERNWENDNEDTNVAAFKKSKKDNGSNFINKIKDFFTDFF
ncbi:MAG: cell division protein FtsA [Clostridiales bacterium]|nr:cell division protein FtsA [Clostridiales bacterium]HBM81826.1 cell division protein FtsA [Clostridiaceae bacterium]